MIEADAAPDNGVAVERREAQRPTLLGARAPKRLTRVTGLSRGRAAGFAKPAKGGLASPLAPPGAPFPRLGKRKKGSWRVPRLQRIGPAQRCLNYTTPKLSIRRVLPILAATSSRIWSCLRVSTGASVSAWRASR